ncbi:uncharacterized protein LOC119284049 [Triticum dicoccoides]|uniref:uncharacterized protein LOC119284049 n=1 Tax=Triticum dicoccoides TaxID=85692 RepID=UPI00188DE49E|nr:uncharacterized protein LOC119284049 [Triticum dicoccoides]
MGKAASHRPSSAAAAEKTPPKSAHLPSSPGSFLSTKISAVARSSGPETPPAEHRRDAAGNPPPESAPEEESAWQTAAAQPSLTTCQSGSSSMRSLSGCRPKTYSAAAPSASRGSADYDAETWGFQYQFNLLAMEVSPPIDLGIMLIPMTTLINERELLIQQRLSRLLHCEIDGVSLRDVENEEHEYHLLPLTAHRLQESMISLPLFETQENAVDKEAPFVIVL